MRLFTVFVFVITFICMLCEAKPTNDCRCEQQCPIEQEFPKKYALAIRQLYESVSSESKSCNNDLPEHLRKDTALILSVVLGYSAFPGGLLVGGINGLIRGMFLSRGDIFQIFACGIYAGATGAEHAIQKGFYNGASAAINSAGFNTPQADLNDNNWLCKCPGDSQDQLEALISSIKRVIGATLHTSGNTIVPGLANGALKGGGNILKRSNNCPNNGNFITNRLNYGLQGFEEGTSDGFVNTVSEFQKIPL